MLYRQTEVWVQVNFESSCQRWKDFMIGGHISNSQPTDFSGFWPVAREPAAGLQPVWNDLIVLQPPNPPHHFQFKSDWPGWSLLEIHFKIWESPSVQELRQVAQFSGRRWLANPWLGAGSLDIEQPVQCAVILCSYIVQLYCAAKSYIVQQHIYCADT